MTWFNTVYPTRFDAMGVKVEDVVSLWNDMETRVEAKSSAVRLLVVASSGIAKKGGRRMSQLLSHE
jgi:hypothetical protein